MLKNFLSISYEKIVMMSRTANGGRTRGTKFREASLAGVPHKLASVEHLTKYFLLNVVLTVATRSAERSENS